MVEPRTVIHLAREALQKVVVGLDPAEVELSRIGEIYGLASHIYRGCWKEAGVERSAVVKIWPTDGKAGTREIQFYTTFGPSTGVRIPICYYAAVDEEEERGILLLEDLRQATQGDYLEQIDLDKGLALARGLAGLHARWLDCVALREAKWLPSLAGWKPRNDWLAWRRTTFRDRYGDLLDWRTHILLDRIEGAPAIVHERLHGSFMTLLHGDLHLDNILFLDGEEPAMVDWAGCARGPAIFDLADLLFDACRLENLEPVLEEYLNAFEIRSGKTLARPKLRRQLGGALLRRFARSTCGIADWQPATAREQAMIEIGVARAVASVAYWYDQDPALFSFQSD